MNNNVRYAAREIAVSSWLLSFNALMATANTDSIRYGTNGAQWHNVAIDEDEGVAQVLDYTGLNGGPCRDRTYDQLIKRR